MQHLKNWWLTVVNHVFPMESCNFEVYVWNCLDKRGLCSQNNCTCSSWAFFTSFWHFCYIPGTDQSYWHYVCSDLHHIFGKKKTQNQHIFSSSSFLQCHRVKSPSNGLGIRKKSGADPVRPCQTHLDHGTPCGKLPWCRVMFPIHWSMVRWTRSSGDRRTAIPAGGYGEDLYRRKVYRKFSPSICRII